MTTVLVKTFLNSSEPTPMRRGSYAPRAASDVTQKTMIKPTAFHGL